MNRGFSRTTGGKPLSSLNIRRQRAERRFRRIGLFGVGLALASVLFLLDKSLFLNNLFFY